MSLIYKNETVVESALTACLEIQSTLPDIVRKCQEEFQSILFSNKFTNSHYKAFLLLKEITANDQVTFQKILLKMIKQSDIYNEVTLLYLIRTLGQIMTQNAESIEQNFQFQILKFLREMCDEEGMIGVEACKTICSFNNIDNQTLKPIVENMIMKRLLEGDSIT